LSKGLCFVVHGTHARQELARIEILGQIIVGSHLETDDTVGIFPLGREHDDGNGAVGAQTPAKAQAVVARQHDVEHDQVDSSRRQYLLHRPAIGRDRHPIAMLDEEFRQQVTNGAIVIDDQKMWRRHHFDSYPIPRAH